MLTVLPWQITVEEKPKCQKLELFQLRPWLFHTTGNTFTRITLFYKARRSVVLTMYINKGDYFLSVQRLHNLILFENIKLFLEYLSRVNHSHFIFSIPEATFFFCYYNDTYVNSPYILSKYFESVAKKLPHLIKELILVKSLLFMTSRSLFLSALWKPYLSQDWSFFLSIYF